MTTVSTRTVLHAVGWSESKGDSERAHILKMFYVADITGEDKETKLTELLLDPNVYKEMGEPDTITITIDVGDLLNTPKPQVSEAEKIAINNCPTPFYHETHNYCPNCPWNVEMPEIS